MAVVKAEQMAAGSRLRESAQLERLKAREAAAWADLFETHHRTVYRTVRALVNDRSAAEDLTGQVFLEALEGIGRYRDRGKPIAAWLLAIARHRSLDWLRKQRREQKAIEQEQRGHAAEDHGAAAEALSVLETLKPEQREVVVLRFVEERSIEEVAELTNRSAGAVKSLQHRALNNLRDALGVNPEEGQR